MNAIKRFDFFRKPQTELQTQTVLGACLSLVTIAVVICLLLCSTFYPFWLKTSHYQVALSQTPNNKFTINLDIILYHSPCIAVTLEIKDKTGSQIIDSKHNSTVFQRTSMNGIEINDDYIDPLIKQQYSTTGKKMMILLTGLENEERCRINGLFIANKVPSILSITYKASQNDLIELKEAEPQFYSKLNLAHKIMELTFGSKPIINIAKGTGFVHDIPQSCNYYMRVVPYIYQYKEEVYKYTMHSNCFVGSSQLDEENELLFYYETLPIVVVYEQEISGRLLIVLEIVCGVYVIIRILHSILLKVFSFLGIKD